VNISNCVQNEDGSLDFEFHVDHEEATYLMGFAIQTLIQLGTISVSEQEEQDIDLFPEPEGSLQ
jgi:hypothetical protein